MKKPLAHQIDTLAQRVFESALPPSWVANPHRHDCGKDSLRIVDTCVYKMLGCSFHAGRVSQNHTFMEVVQNKKAKEGWVEVVWRGTRENIASVRYADEGETAPAQPSLS